MNYLDVFKREEIGSLGDFGLRISVASDHALTESERLALDRAYDDLRETFGCESIKLNAEVGLRAARERAEILALFPQPIFVEEIPNGYCPLWCCSTIPWFLVTTHIGRIEIGWRKRVINIDWSKSIVTKTAEQMFPDEQTTKGIQYIHAWGIEKAAEYVGTLLRQVKEKK